MSFHSDAHNTPRQHLQQPRITVEKVIPVYYYSPIASYLNVLLLWTCQEVYIFCWLVVDSELLRQKVRVAANLCTRKNTTTV